MPSSTTLPCDSTTPGLPHVADVARTLSVDLDAAPGDQSLQALEVGPNATFTVAVYGYGVDELIGFTHKVAFDSTQLSLVQIDGARRSEDNILQAEGGTALFLRDTASDGAVEYGGGGLADQFPGDPRLFFFLDIFLLVL